MSSFLIGPLDSALSRVQEFQCGKQSGRVCVEAEDGSGTAFMVASVGGKQRPALQKERDGLCARFGREGNDVEVSNKRAL